MYKQVIVVRNELQMPAGKMAAQVAHAALAAVIKDTIDKTPISKSIWGEEELPGEDWIHAIRISEDTHNWLEESFTKVVVTVETEEEIFNLAKQAEGMGLPVAVMVDNGSTVFHNVKTVTCLAIGPGKRAEIDKVTGGLPLHK
jgi:peptidyl-tRNA hydrolase